MSAAWQTAAITWPQLDVVREGGRGSDTRSAAATATIGSAPRNTGVSRAPKNMAATVASHT